MTSLSAGYTQFCFCVAGLLDSLPKKRNMHQNCWWVVLCLGPLYSTQTPTW